jgi:hypothetical protein
MVLSLVGGGFLGGFVLGSRSVDREPVRALGRERDALADELANLRQQVVACERVQQIEQERDRSAQAQLKAAQDERLALVKEVSALKRLVSEGARSAVSVQGLTLVAMDGEHAGGSGAVPGLVAKEGEYAVGKGPASATGSAQREYRYGFTVSQLVEGVGETSGSIDIKVSGRQGDKDKTLSLKQLKGSRPTKLAMRFDHFQTIEGQLVLPEGFEPKALTVEIRPAGDKLIASAETFPWRVGTPAVGGGPEPALVHDQPAADAQDIDAEDPPRDPPGSP